MLKVQFAVEGHHTRDSKRRRMAAATSRYNEYRENTWNAATRPEARYHRFVKFVASYLCIILCKYT